MSLYLFYIVTKSEIIKSTVIRGFMVYIEMVKDNGELDKDIVGRTIKELLRKGVITYKPGICDNVLRFMSPLNIPKILFDRGLQLF
ncbi:hypothetical protein [Acidianus sp. RZ1]|uniref:hypothetical protein n=1 Tax=Acidianus sp. RZ1 TaxID=1540082 RepID=UPI001491C7BC|nr:hypothetical protein [Acidianus sp. RZ1]NON61112.1 hypothetical protein [Acidianus sp. RZ1]